MSRPIKFSTSSKTLKRVNLLPKKQDDLPLSFCFEYASLRKGRLCFNNPNYEPGDLIKLIEFFKTIAVVPSRELDDRFHFHTVNLANYKFGAIYDNFKRTIKRSIPDETQLPTLYYIQVFTDNKRSVAPRLVFYIAGTVAKVIYFDYHHLLFDKLYHSGEKIPDNWVEAYNDINGS